MGFAANGNNPWLRVCDTTRLIFFTADTVNDMPLRHLDIGFRHWANDVDLVVFPRQVAGIDVNDVISVIESEHGVCPVPMDVMNFLSLNWVDEKHHHREKRNET